MSLFSGLNNIVGGVVGAVAGSKAKRVYKSTSEALGDATLETVEVAGEIVVGTAKTVAFAVPATLEFTKGMAVELMNVESLKEFDTKWEAMNDEQRKEVIKEVGASTMFKIRESLREEEEVKEGK